MTRGGRPAGWSPLLAATFAIGVSNSVVFATLSDLQDRYGFSDAGLGWIAAAAIAFAWLAPRPLPQPVRSPHAERIALDLLRLPRIRVGLLLSAGLYLPVGVYDALWDRYLTDRGASNTMIGLSFLLYGIPFVLLAAAGGRTADRIGPTRAAVLAILLAAPLTGSYGLLAAPWIIVAASVVEGSVHSLAVPGAQATVAAAAPPGRATAAQGLAGSTQLLAAAVAAIASPAIYGSVGAGPVFLLAGALMVVCAASAAVLARPRALS